MGEDGIGGRVVSRGRQWKREELPSFRPDPARRPRTRQEPGHHQTPQVTALHKDFAASLLAGALALVLPLRRSVVFTLLSAAAIGVIIALAAGTVSP
jgi:hypothetical protein